MNDLAWTVASSEDIQTGESDLDDTGCELFASNALLLRAIRKVLLDQVFQIRQRKLEQDRSPPQET